jgi:hypothetical protein
LKLLSCLDVRSRKTALCRAYTLPEVLVSFALGAFILAAIISGSTFTLRSFVAMFNYTDMDSKSCTTLDWMSRDVRQATLVGYTNNSSAKALVFQGLNSAGSPITITYAWNPNTGEVTCSKTGQPDLTYLTGCENWDFSLFSRAPSPNYAFNTVTNASDCKLVELTWTCTRSKLKPFDTESIQTAQIVLRN